LEGGEVGAWLVAWPDGHHGVLTWLPATNDSRTVDEAQALMALARRAGVPVPMWEAVVGLGPLGTAVLQACVVGGVPDGVSEALAGALVGLADKRRGLLAGTAFAGMPMPLYLTSPGPGFCLHEPLRAFGPKTAALLERVHAVGERHGDHLVGDDIVHYDYHPGNVLVDPDRPDVVSWVVDWGGVRPGRGFGTVWPSGCRSCGSQQPFFLAPPRRRPVHTARVRAVLSAGRARLSTMQFHLISRYYSHRLSGQGQAGHRN
jgi:hypothetical protein